MVRARQLAAVAVLAGMLVLPGCSDPSGEAAAPAPVRVVPVAGTAFKKIVLAPSAVARIGVRTAPATTTARAGLGRTLAVPYAAIIYEPNGTPSVYTSPAPRTYVRQPVLIDEVAGSTAFLRRGPPAGTPVVEVGAAELFGVETGVQGE
jgi:hypothetical protein